MVGWGLLWLLRLLVPAGFLILMVLFIRFPLGAEPQHGVVRFSWRTVGQRVRLCRPYTPEEQARLPKHMQISTERCSHSLLPYRLRAWADGRMVVEREVRPAGWRGDRPLFVNEEIPFRPGAYRIRVEFRPLGNANGAGSAAQIAEPGPEAARRQAEAEALRMAPIYRLERPITVRAGRVLLVGLDEETDRLFLAVKQVGR